MMKIYQKAHKKYFTNAIPTIMKITKCWNERVKIRHCLHEECCHRKFQKPWDFQEIIIGPK